MDDMYGLHPDYPDLSPENLILPSDYHSLMTNSGASFLESFRFPAAVSYSDELISTVSEAVTQVDDDTTIKAKIASHRQYPRLLKTYIDCYKVVAPPETGRILDKIRQESDIRRQQEAGDMLLVTDPELDEFMEAYCEILNKYKLDLSRPFDEAKNFLSKFESQLRDLCNVGLLRTASEEGGMSSDEECSGGEVDVQDMQEKDKEQDLKDELIRKFGSDISDLRLGFSKKKKKTKLPKEAIHDLFEWWRAHYKWPYPTEADKIALSERTGLDQRQINNWFINQRKRHWKPPEDLQIALMDNLSRK